MSKRDSSASGFIYDPAADIELNEVEIATTMKILGISGTVGSTTIDEIITASRAMHPFTPIDERSGSPATRKYRPAAEEFMVVEARGLDEHVRQCWYWRSTAKGFQAL